MSVFFLLLGTIFSASCSIEGANEDFSFLVSFDSVPHLQVIATNKEFTKIYETIHYNFTLTNTKITSIGVDYRKKQVFLMKNSIGHIQVLEGFRPRSLDAFKNKSLHTGISKADAEMSVDWITGNVYWVDAWMNWIMMQPSKTNFTSKMYLPIVYKHLDHPCSITLDPIAGYLFWGDCGHVPVIERSTLAGEDRVILANQSVLYPISMKADNNGVLFWVDRSRHTVERMNYNGQKRRVIIRLPGSDLTCLTIYENHVIVADYFNSIIMGLDKYSGKQTFLLRLNIHQHPWAVEIYSKDTQPYSTDPCKSRIVCQHMCVRTNTGSAQCLCQAGFTLMANGRDCQKNNDNFEMEAIVTDQKYICGFDLLNLPSPFWDNTFSCPYYASGNISHMAVNTKLGHLYIASSNQIDVLALNENKSVTLVNKLPEKVGDLKYDWMDRNLLFTQPKRGLIVALSLDNRRYVKILEKRKSPSYLTLDVHRRHIYWIEESNSIWSIYMADIDGKNVTLLPLNSSLTNPGHLAYYANTKLLFFIDDGEIKYINVELSPKQEDTYVVKSIPVDIIHHSRSLTVWKDYLLWIEPGNQSQLISMSIKEMEIVSRLRFQQDIQEILIFDRTMQMGEPYPCAIDCEQMCLPSSKTGHCACGFGYSLSNGIYCVSDVKENDNFLLVADIMHHEIYQIDMASEDVQALKQFSRIITLDLAYDGTKKEIYVLDDISNIIYEDSLISEIKAIEMPFNGDFLSARKLVLDKKSGNIYFSMYNSTLSRYFIGVKKGKKSKILIDSNTASVDGLAVNFGLIFWTNTSAVYRAYGDGSHSTVIVPSTFNSSPRQITIDVQNKRIYWVQRINKGGSFIYSATLDGSNSTIYENLTGIDIVDIVIDGDFLFYTATNKLAIMKMSLKNRTQSEFSRHPEFGQLGSFVIHTNSHSGPNHPCTIKNGGCDTFCLPRGDQYVCACETGIKLIDEKSCDATCNNFIKNGIFTEECSFKKGAQCNFLCAETLSTSYISALNEPVLTCGNDTQWNFPVDKLCIDKDAIVCPTNSVNGSLEIPCNISNGGNCNFKCSPGYISHLTNVTCVSGEWDNDIDKLCLIPVTAEISSDGGLSVASLVGIGISIVVILAVLGVVGFFVWKKFLVKKDNMSVKFVTDDLNSQQ